ncbi:MAG: DUF2474 domain-containing protein [Acetobacteraceae bacterium]|nr:MAG: DUF2474 domain-containing protein [Acetobacteraceae bacterium]
MPGWVRQLLWFVALWCMGTGVLAAVAYAIRAVLFA